MYSRIVKGGLGVGLGSKIEVRLGARLETGAGATSRPRDIECFMIGLLQLTEGMIKRYK